jgi:hypothetical protein
MPQTLVAPFAALVAPLGSAKDIASFKLTNKTGQAAKEFHFVITSATDDFQPTKITNDGGFTANTTNTSIDASRGDAAEEWLRRRLEGLEKGGS